MKFRIIILLAFSMLPLGAAAQNMFDQLYEKYKGKNEFTTLDISPEMLKRMGTKSADKERAASFDGIEGIRIVSCEKPSGQFIDELKRLPGPGYKSMISMNDRGQQVSVFCKEAAQGKKAEFLLVIYGGKDNLAMKIDGDIDIKKISGLTGVNISGGNK